jgi:hypothetical protein
MVEAAGGQGVGSSFLASAELALSGDGNTAIVGGYGDNSGVGAAWVFTRSGGGWSQQGAKLVGFGGGSAEQGFSISLSGDGNTAIIGGPFDSFATGAAWRFTRSGGVWSEQAKLVGSGAVGNAQQGASVALSADGNTAFVGGPIDNSGVGAAWVFPQLSAKTVATASHDFNGSGFSDIAWRDASGSVAAWLMSGAQVVGAFGLGTVPNNWSIVGQRDFNNDGHYDLLWRDANTGTVAIWLLTGTNALALLQTGTLGAVPGNWTIAATSDLNFDGHGDIIWRDSNTGTVAVWLLHGLSILQGGTLGAVPGNWVIAGTDGKGNIYWRDQNTGTVAIWQMYGLEVLQTVGLGAVPLNWAIVGTGDFDGNGDWDILWKDTSGNLAIWLMSGLQVSQAGGLGNTGTSWNVAQTGDYNGDGKSDILWRDTGGNTAIWFMNGLQIASTGGLGNVPTTWTVQGVNAD